MKLIRIRRQVKVVEEYLVQVDDDMPPLDELYEDLSDMISNYAEPIVATEHDEKFQLSLDDVSPELVKSCNHLIVDLTRSAE